jgi:hypothetical protein
MIRPMGWAGTSRDGPDGTDWVGSGGDGLGWAETGRDGGLTGAGQALRWIVGVTEEGEGVRVDVLLEWVDYVRGGCGFADGWGVGVAG